MTLSIYKEFWSESYLNQTSGLMFEKSLEFHFKVLIQISSEFEQEHIMDFYSDKLSSFM